MKFAELGNAKYIALETFRKSGEGVITPIWVTPEEGKLYVWTVGDSWKVKRIRNNNRRFIPAIGARALIPVLVVMLVLAACIAPAGQTESDQNTPVTTAGTVESTTCSGLPTSANQEGPYYSAGSPTQANLVEEGMAGSPVRIVGQVFDTLCNPIAGAKLDFWQADFDGVYDNVGFTLRGHVFTDDEGAYALESIEPGPYTGRPPHIHVKVFAPDGQELLTSQIYTSGSEDSADVRAAPDLLASYVETDAAGVKQVLFDFVLDTID